MKKVCKRECYGTTTLGEKGQVVIPAQAREAMKLKKGDKLLVFGMDDMLAFAKVSQLEDFAKQLSDKVESIRGLIKKSE
jgi:AbrB family looped-hinge helix DNA binding protein